MTNFVCKYPILVEFLIPAFRDFCKPEDKSFNPLLIQSYIDPILKFLYHKVSSLVIQLFIHSIIYYFVYPLIYFIHSSLYNYLCSVDVQSPKASYPLHASPAGYSSRRYSTNQTTYSCPGPGSMY